MILLWGSNARETHPIFFHHVLKAIHNGARLMVIDPRRSASAQWADLWLGLDVGGDIALANAVAREIIHEGLTDERFIANATSGYEEYAASVEPYTLEEGERLSGVPAAAIRELAHAYGRADRAILCWTLGITEHHNAVDNVLALINLALLTGHVGKYGSGLNPLRGQNNVQGGGDMGAIPNKLPGFQDIEKNADARALFEEAWGVPIVPKYGWHLTQMFEAMERGELRTLYVIGENPADSEADRKKAMELLEGLDFLVVQDIVMTRTARLADVVLPGSASWAEADGTVTSSERRVQLCRKALDPPGEARDDIWIIAELARRLGFDWGHPTAEEAWDELRTLSPMHGGMRYDRLAEHGGLQWPCPTEDHPGSQYLHGRLWKDPVEGPLAPFSVTPFEPPVDELDEDFPIRLTTGRRLESYNTGAQSNLYRSPLHRGESLDLSPEDAERLGIENGEIVLVSSRRGAVRAPARIDRILRPGLAFMTFHFPEQVATNDLTIDATDPKSGTAEFKATAIRVEKLPVEDAEAMAAGVSATGGNGDGGCARRTAIARPLRTGTAGRFGSPSNGPATAARCAHGRRASGGRHVSGRHHRVAQRPRSRGNRRWARHARRPRGPRPAASAAADPRARAGADGVDQRGRARLHLRAAHGAAGRRVRGRHVLRPAVDGPTAGAGPARVRRRRVPLPGRRGADRRARGADRTRGRRLRRLHLASEPVPRPVRPGAGGDADAGRRAPDRARAGGGHRRGRDRRAEGRDRPRAAAGRSAPAGRPRSSGCFAGSASSIRGACTTTAPAAGTRRSGARSRSDRGT